MTWASVVLPSIAHAASLVAPTPAPLDTPPLSVAASTDHYPYSFVGPTGEFDGFAVDVLDAVSRAMGIRLERHPVSGPEAATSVRAGIRAQQLVTESPEQAARIGLSVPYLTLQGTIFVRAGDSRFHTADDLRKTHARIATGQAGFDYGIRAGFSPAQLTMDSAEGCLRKLARGEVDAVMLSRLTGLATLHRTGIPGIDARAGIADDFVLRFCFGTAAGDRRLLDQLNEGLAIIFQTGEYGRIYRKWFSDFEQPGFTREQVVAYTAAALGAGLLLALLALARQRHLRYRIGRQATELAESRELLAEAQQLAQVGHWRGTLLFPDKSTWSEELYRIFEREIRMGPPKTLDELLNYLIPEDRERWRTCIDRLSREAQPYSIDISIEPRHGVRKTIHVRGRVVYDPMGARIDVFGTMQDITAHRAAELALRQSEEILRALYDNLPHALGVVESADVDWNVIALNPEAIRVLGLGAAPILPCRFSSLGLQSEVEREWKSRFDRCAHANAAVKVDAHSTDGRRDYVITLVPLGHRANQFRGCFVVEDVTEQRRKDAEIAQGRRLRALGELVGGIAHEFNNLLTPILIKADQLHADATTNPELRSDLKLIVDAAQRSAELTRRLLTFGRQPERKPELVDIRAIITSNVELLRHTIDRRIDIQCTIPPGLPLLYLCASDVHQILVNLLLNARDTLIEKLSRPPAADWSAHIRVEVTERPGGPADRNGAKKNSLTENWITITVSDNGMGMAPAVMERIFEPFYTTKEVGRGTGLGLATVWYLVTELGGRVDVESVKGEGSTFFISIPVNAAPLARPNRPSANRRLAMRPLGPPMRILVVDDEPPITQLVSNVLQVRGHSITVLQHGQIGWERLSQNPTAFDALIVDLNLPGITGLELTRRARALPFGGPIIVMSGRVTDEERREFTALGVSAILEKPFVAVELLNALATTADPVSSGATPRPKDQR